MSIQTFKTQLGTEKSYHTFVQYLINKHNKEKSLTIMNGLLSHLSNKEDECRKLIAEDINQNHIQSKEFWNQPAVKVFELVESKARECLGNEVKDGTVIDLFLFYSYAHALDARLNYGFRSYHGFKIGSTWGCLFWLIVLAVIAVIVYFFF